MDRGRGYIGRSIGAMPVLAGVGSLSRSDGYPNENETTVNDPSSADRSARWEPIARTLGPRLPSNKRCAGYRTMVSCETVMVRLTCTGEHCVHNYVRPADYENTN